MPRCKNVAVALITWAASVPSYAYQVIGIHDGDTMTLLVDRKPVKIRLANIDAPEMKQPFGRRAKEVLSDLCWGKDAEYEAQNIDRYGRTVAVVYCDGIEANRSLVASGMAWVYRKYNKDRSLWPLEQEAQAKGMGLWADKEPVPPWEWREAERRLTRIGTHRD